MDDFNGGLEKDLREMRNKIERKKKIGALFILIRSLDEVAYKRRPRRNLSCEPQFDTYICTQVHTPCAKYLASS